MIIEGVRGDAAVASRLVGARAGLAPAGLRYVGSWVTSDLARLSQVTECEDPELLERWKAEWADLVEFEAVKG